MHGALGHANSSHPLVSARARVLTSAGRVRRGPGGAKQDMTPPHSIAGLAGAAAAERDRPRRACERAARDLLRALGADVDAEALLETPRRVADAYAELLTPAARSGPTTFPNDDGYDELIVARASRSTRSACTTCCRSTASRTSATCRGERIIGLSKLGRVVELFARDLQIQERLTDADRRAGSSASSSPRASAWCWRPSTCACRCAACRSSARDRDLGAARRGPRRCPHPPGVPGPDRRGHSMTSDQTFVIVGASLAGAKAAETLRAEGFDGRDRAGRRRGRAPVRAPAAVEGVPARRGRAREGLRARGGLLRRARHRAAPRPRGGRASTRRAGELDARRRRAAALRPAAARHRRRAAPARRSRAPSSTASSTCAASATPTRCASGWTAAARSS